MRCLCVLKCAYLHGKLVSFLPCLWEKIQAVSEASGSLKEAVVEPIFLSFLPLCFSLLCPPPTPTQSELKDMTLDETSLHPSLSPLSSHFPFPFFLYLRA